MLKLELRAEIGGSSNAMRIGRLDKHSVTTQILSLSIKPTIIKQLKHAQTKQDKRCSQDASNPRTRWYAPEASSLRSK